MKIGVLGTGMVGTTLAAKFAELGHEVMVGSRGGQKGEGDMQKGTFGEVAEFGEIIFNCTKGEFSLIIFEKIDKAHFEGKILVDVANPLDFSKGMPPTLLYCNTESLGEKLQEMLPDTKVVKALNTLSATLMTDPGKLNNAEHDLFIAGNDEGAKSEVTKILKEWFGWKTIHDLGGIEAARATEMYLPLWLRLWGKLQTADFNIKVVR